ncbi:hypothetical protein FXF51_57515 [Nonomuraea sp. PA05]|nr:hypothetical protein FXF51_57515 [Nonomuraea sp. PA05]
MAHKNGFTSARPLRDSGTSSGRPWSSATPAATTSPARNPSATCSASRTSPRSSSAPKGCARTLLEVLLLHRHMDGEHVVAGLAAALPAGALTADAVAGYPQIALNGPRAQRAPHPLSPHPIEYTVE